MPTLEIIIQEIVDEDYDGNPETVKELTSKIDGEIIQPCMSFETSVSDADAKTAYKAELTELEYTWDAEI